MTEITDLVVSHDGTHTTILAELYTDKPLLSTMNKNYIEKLLKENKIQTSIENVKLHIHNMDCLDVADVYINVGDYGEQIYFEIICSENLPVISENDLLEKYDELYDLAYSKIKKGKVYEKNI